MDLSDPRLTPGGSFAEQTRRFLGSPFPFDRKQLAEQDVARFEAEAEQAMQTCHFERLPDLIDRLWSRHRELMDPRPRPGEPKPWSAAAEFEKFADEMQAKGWRGRILGHWRAMIRPDERIQSVGYFEIVTDQRRVARSEIRDFGRTVAETNSGFFERQFLSDVAVQQIEADAAETAARQAAPIVGGRNLDLPDPRAKA